MAKKYIILAALALCFAAKASAQTVVVEKDGRAAVSYYSPEMGFTIDLNIGYTLGLGDANKFANSTPLPSYHFGIGYAFDEHWKIGLSYQKAYLQEDLGPRTYYIDYFSISGHAVNNIDFDNILLSGEYAFPVSRWVRPYVGLSLGLGSVDMYTDIAGHYSYSDSKWMLTVVPEVGLRGYFDKNMTVGYRATMSYNQYFGSLKVFDNEMSSPSYLRIGAGVFVKFL